MIEPNSNQKTNFRSSSLIGPAPESIRSCPKCASVFVTDTECESCGLQLSFDYYGEPMGDKSFYALRVGAPRGSTEYFYPEKRRQYQRNLIHRYKLLLEYFFEDRRDNRRKYFLIELKDMISELITYKIDEEIIWRPLDELSRKDDQILFHIVQQAIAQGQEQLVRRREESFLHRKWLGVLSTGVIVRVTLLTCAVVALSLGVFRYLML